VTVIFRPDVVRATVGVPVIAPVTAEKARPVGSVPVRANDFVPEPPPSKA